MDPIACFYLADYPAWVRQQMAPGEPYIAVHADGRIIARSHDLRTDGLRIGESLERAQLLFPHGVYYRHDPQLDAAIWEDVVYLLADLAPQLQSVEPGWALMHAWDEQALESLVRSLGGRLGSAPRRFTARMAALQAPAGTVRRVAPEGVRAFYEKTSVRNLKEVGFELDLVERLELFGLYTLGRVARLERRHLGAQFGSEGERLHGLLHPSGDEPPIALFQPPPSVSASYDFEFPASEPAELVPVLDHLLEEAVPRLGALRAQLLTIRLQGRGEDGVRLMRRVLKAPTARSAHLRVIASRLLDEMVDGEAPVDSMTVELGGLVQATATQGGLFADRPAVYESVRALHQRFPGRIFRAVITDAEAYLPEEGVRLEPYPVEPGGRRRQ